MHEKSPILTAKKRERLGSRYSARLREQGALPAIVYGHKQDPVPVSLDFRDAASHITRGEKVFRLQLDGEKGDPQIVLLKELQFDYLGTRVVHADFARVSLTDRVTVRVPLRLIGEARGLKTAGAILMHPTAEIEIECMVTDIPDAIEVLIDELDVDHAISAGQVKLPVAGMKLKTDTHAIVAQIVIQQEEVVATEAAPVEGAAAEPEVITAKKKEGEEGEPAGGAAKTAAAGAKAAPDKKAAAPAKEEKKK
jgi:large subunit ribosomal protein L25